MPNVKINLEKLKSIAKKESHFCKCLKINGACLGFKLDGWVG